jgi:hypothetical protein
MQTLCLAGFRQVVESQVAGHFASLFSQLPSSGGEVTGVTGRHGVLSLTKREVAGTMKKPRWNCNPGLAGVSPTALVPEWRNWQTR